MPPVALEYVRSVLEMNTEKSFHLNLGNDRHNIAPLVWPMESGASNLSALDFVVRGRDQPLRTIIYFNNKRLTMRACNYLRKLLPPSQAHTIDILHATRGPHAKEAMERFRTGKILVLCSTEVVGMARSFTLTYSGTVMRLCYYRARTSQTLMTSCNS
jgi:superfamily II DNA/RNA helicase